MNRLRREVGEQLIAAYSSVEMPPRLVENEARAMLAQQVEQIRRNGQNVGEIPADAHEGFKDAAAKRVLVGLLVAVWRSAARSVRTLPLSPRRWGWAPRRRCRSSPLVGLPALALGGARRCAALWRLRLLARWRVPRRALPSSARQLRSYCAIRGFCVRRPQPQFH
jgi:hypothetical protein